jgi:hypothetical protein
MNTEINIKKVYEHNGHLFYSKDKLINQIKQQKIYDLSRTSSGRMKNFEFIEKIVDDKEFKKQFFEILNMKFADEISTVVISEEETTLEEALQHMVSGGTCRRNLDYVEMNQNDYYFMSASVLYYYDSEDVNSYPVTFELNLFDPGWILIDKVEEAL